uniref:Uncharacterized protein n=1 Tax=Cucumis melo TaxID=3656 RepID=A0A9I9EG66_CUCME
MQFSASGQTSGKVSWDRLSRRCVGHASGKPLPTPSFLTQSTTSGKPPPTGFTGDKRDPEKVRTEREELERQQREDWSLYIDDDTIIVEKVERSKLFQEVTNSFFNTEKALLQAEAKAAEDARREVEAEVATAARDNDEGRQRRWNERRRMFLSSPNLFPFVFSSV